MNAYLFNACIAIGWLMISAGAFMLNRAAGLITGGTLMLVLVLVLARMAGLYMPKKGAR